MFWLMGEKSFQMFFRNEDVVKGFLLSGTHVEPRSVHALNETTFLVTNSSGILADEIGPPLKGLMNGWVNQ